MPKSGPLGVFWIRLVNTGMPKSVPVCVFWIRLVLNSRQYGQVGYTPLYFVILCYCYCAIDTRLWCQLKANGKNSMLTTVPISESINQIINVAQQKVTTSYFIGIKGIIVLVST